MPKTLIKATAHLQSGTQVKVKASGFEITIDEPKEAGGTDTGMNPVELLLSSLGACQAICASVFAKKFEIDLEDFWVEIEGDLDTDGFMHLSDVRPGFSDIRYNFHVKTSAPREKVEKLAAFIEESCPVGDTLANTVNLKLNEIIIEEAN